MLVIGDSIAVGTASSLSPTKTSAKVGANSRTIAGFDGSGTFTQMVISAGSNDKGQNFTAAQQQSYLRTIRDKQPNAKTVWILPYDSAMRAVVQGVASSYGDSTVNLSQFSSSDGLHPSSYSSVAAAVKTALGSSGNSTTQESNDNNVTSNTTGSAVNSSSTSTGLVPCGGRGEDPCTLCHFIVGIHGIIAWFMGVMVFLALTIITAMGVLYVVSGGNEGLMKTAKGGLSSALIGILVVLFAWLIVNVIMFWILPSKTDLGVQAGFSITNGFQFECSTTSTAGTALGGTGLAGGGTPSNALNCQPLTSGVCSVDSLKSVFGSNAERMSRICHYESGGSAGNLSNTDRCKNDPDKRAFSIGLYQINLTVHKLGALNCPSAFEGKNYDCKIKDESLYAQCVAAAKNPTTNINKAAELSNNGANISPWKNTVNTCGIQ